MTEKKKTKKKLDLPQAIVISVVLGSLAIAAGLVLAFGPADSRSQVGMWIGEGIAGIGVVYAAMRAKGLFSTDESED